MSRQAGSEVDDSGARTLGAGVFLLLAGVSIALLVVNIPLGIAALAASAVAGFLAARKRTSDEGLPGGPVEASSRLEGFIVDPLASGEPDPYVPAHDDVPQQWADGLPGPAEHRVPDEFAPPAQRPLPDEPVEAIEAIRSYDDVDQLFFDAEVPPVDDRVDPDLGGLAPLDDELERDHRIGHLRSAHAEAAEQLNVAIARWHQLAGDDADPFDPEPVIRAHDPQLVFDPRHVDASPTVRTVAAYHRNTQARWRVLWASLGADEVPDPADVDGLLASMLADHHHATAELAQLEAAEARAAARTALARPIVVVEPSAWISGSRLDQVLSSLPDETDVVVVDRAS